MIQRTNVLLNVSGLAAAAAGSGTPYSTPLIDAQSDVVATVVITGTLTVKIEGRMDPTDTWTTLASVTVSGPSRVARYPHMRASYSGASAGAAGAVRIDRYCKPSA